MDWKAVIAIAIGALFIIGTDTFKFWKRKKPLARGVIIGPARPSYSGGRIFIAQVLSTLAINVLALISLGALLVMADQNIHWAWSIVPLFGWLVVWGFVVNQLLFPKAYLDYVDKLPTPPIGLLPAAICAAVWMVALLFAVAPILSVD